MLVKFRTAGNMSNKGQIILRDPKGRLWPVRIYYSGDNAMSCSARLGAGWEKFWINNLEEGDACVFKLVSNRSNDILHASIFKKKSRKQCALCCLFFLVWTSSWSTTINGLSHLEDSNIWNYALCWQIITVPWTTYWI